MVLIPFGARLLALDDDTFQAALKAGETYLPATPAPSTPAAEILDAEVLDAEGMQARTGVPASWFEQAAREGRIPCLRLGKYVRFDLKAVLATLTRDPLTGRPTVAAKRLKAQAL